MAIRYGFKPSGCFVVVDTTFPWWFCAFDTSPLQVAALKDPRGAALKAIEHRDSDMRLIRAMSGKRQRENREHWETLKRYGVDELCGDGFDARGACVREG